MSAPTRRSLIATMLVAGKDDRAIEKALGQVDSLLHQMSKFKDTMLQQRWRVFCGQVVCASIRVCGKEVLSETRVVLIVTELLLMTGVSYIDALSAAKLHVCGAVGAGILVRKNIIVDGRVSEVLASKTFVLPWHSKPLPDQFVHLLDILFDHGGNWVASREVNRLLGQQGIERNAAQIMGDADANGHAPHAWVENARRQYRLHPKILSGV